MTRLHRPSGARASAQRDAMTAPPIKPPAVLAEDDKPSAPVKLNGVQFGPTPTAPGSRLKKDRR